MATRLEIISKELIKPNSPTPHHLKHQRLSYLDQIHLPYFVSRVFFYTRKFHDLVSAFRTVTRKFNNYPEEDVVNNVVSANDPHKILAVINNPKTLYCHFTSGCKLPFHEVYYGWGKPLSVCGPALPVKNRVILMDAKYGEGIQALVTLADEDMKMLPDELLSLETTDLSS